MEKRELFAAVIRITLYVMFAAFASYMIISQTMSGVYLYPTWVLAIILILVILAIAGEAYVLIRNKKKSKEKRN